MGFIGSDPEILAQKLAEKNGLSLISLDKEIEKRDGRSIKKICMLEGEHSYRNKEYEVLKDIDGANYVVVCGDGVILDSDCVDILQKGRIEIAGQGMSVEQLWENARKDKALPYAFLTDPDKNHRMMKFKELYDKRIKLYEEVKKHDQYH